MTMNENVDLPVGLAGSGGTRSKAGSNYGDWSPNRPRVQTSDPADSSVDRGYNPVGMAYKGPRGGRDEPVAHPSAAAASPTMSPASVPGGPPVSGSFARWWTRLKALFGTDHADPETLVHRVDAAIPQPRTSASDRIS